MNDDDVFDLIHDGQRRIADWERRWPGFETDETLQVPPERAREVIAALGERLRDNYPFFHPAYAGQMLKPPHPVAAAAYTMAQRINPNAHALDGGPATSQLEIEVVRELAKMFGYDPASSLGHLTSSGTIANLEALWVARESHPGRPIAYSEEAHYTHSRMCHVIAVEGVAIPADSRGRMDLDVLESTLKLGNAGTIVATAGTTSLGAVDPIDQIIPLARRYGARVHVDAAYGGFFALLAQSQRKRTRATPETVIPSEAEGLLSSGRAGNRDTFSRDRTQEIPPQGRNDDEVVGSGDDAPFPSQHAFLAIAEADSIVVDPHKHGLQPYGCGSVLFKDASVGRFYKHESPYTYFTSAELHLGEISLECSRAGAAAAALWATLQVFPLEADSGFGPILRKTLAAARRWAEFIRESDRLRLVVEPELDILCFYPLPPDGDRRTSAISTFTRRMFNDLMNDPDDPLHLATLQVKPALLEGHGLEWDQAQLTAFRSVLMKPEHLEAVETLHARVLQSVRDG
jgi:glutamate/tyrosine decarboxylase-like PLP-dependent enzyme